MSANESQTLPPSPVTMEADDSLLQTVQRRGSFAQTVKAVAWSFLGVRKGSEYQKDIASINPVHLIVAGVAAGILFVLGLVLLVNWVIDSGVAV